MLNKFLNHRLASKIVFVQRSLIVRTSFDLSTQMKSLNVKKQSKEALELFDTYRETNIGTLSRFTIIQVLKACAQIKDLQRGLATYDLLSSAMKKDCYIVVSLIHLYMQCNYVTRAQSIFDTSINKSLEMYGAMMQGFIQNDTPSKAIDLFHEIKNPDEVIILLLFNACAQLGTNEALHLAKRVSREIPKSFHSNIRLSTSLVDALMKCGDVAHAQSIFDASKKKPVELYGAMMKGFILNGIANKAIDLFNEIKNPNEVIIVLLFNACAQLGTNEALSLARNVYERIPKQFHSNPYLLNSLLDTLIKCGDCSNAEILFSMMDKSTIGYGSLMTGFNKEDNPEKTLNLFNQMKIDGIEPTIITYLCICKALSQIADSSLSQSIVEQIPSCFLVDHRLQTALIDVWGKAGRVDQAKQIFDRIIQPEEIAYTAMINSYGLNGMGLQAVELFRQMPPEFTNEVSYICVLNACSHSGLINDARSIFRNISMKTEAIYNTMVDCFSRAYLLEEAQQLIVEFERDHLPTYVMYMSLLSGARNEKNNHLSQIVYDRMKKVFPKLTDPLVSGAILLANVYASSGESEKASKIRIQLSQSGAKKKIGLSWTVVNGQLFRFRAHDQSHPRSSEIYAELEKISKELIEHGHEYDSSWITRPLNQDETVASVLCGHSEKLAIAWNFVQNPNASRIQVTKNLRVCGDCHQATKLIARIRQCQIIVRDANRIHHFNTNGQCSCNDYF